MPRGGAAVNGNWGASYLLVVLAAFGFSTMLSMTLVACWTPLVCFFELGWVSEEVGWVFWTVAETRSVTPRLGPRSVEIWTGTFMAPGRLLGR